MEGTQDQIKNYHEVKEGSLKEWMEYMAGVKKDVTLEDIEKTMEKYFGKTDPNARRIYIPYMGPGAIKMFNDALEERHNQMLEKAKLYITENEFPMYPQLKPEDMTLYTPPTKEQFDNFINE